MVTLTESKIALMDKWRSEGVDDVLLAAFEAVPREAFVPEDMRDHAYSDQPLQIGHGQTISQPTTIMRMLTLLEARPKDMVLEIGSGCGYVSALLAALGCKVVGVEIVPELAVHSAQTLAQLGYDSVAIHAADGGAGWEAGAPYDRILVSCALPSIPSQVLMQLKDKGVLVAPVGTVEQRMLVSRKDGDNIVEEDHGAYVFVPLTGKYAEEGRDDLPSLPFV